MADAFDVGSLRHRGHGHLRGRARPRLQPLLHRDRRPVHGLRHRRRLERGLDPAARRRSRTWSARSRASRTGTRTYMGGVRGLRPDRGGHRRRRALPHGGARGPSSGRCSPSSPTSSPTSASSSASSRRRSSGCSRAAPSLMLAVIAVYCVINFVIQSIIQPRYVGDAVGLTPTITMLSLVFWAWLLGAAGRPAGGAAQPADAGAAHRGGPRRPVGAAAGLRAAATRRPRRRSPSRPDPRPAGPHCSPAVSRMTVSTYLVRPGRWLHSSRVSCRERPR